MLKQLIRLVALVPTLAVFGIVQSVQADWDINYGGISLSDPQDIVITLKSDPNHDPEAACLAVTFARSLSGNQNANITLFVTLDGVNLASENYITKRRLKEYECTTPPTMSGKILLADHLTTYINGNDDKLIVCPICWKERYEDELPDYGVLPGVTVTDKAIGKMMFNADKVLVF